MILYLKNPRYFIKKTPVNHINTQKPVTFLYTKNEQIEKEIREIIPFKIASKRIKYFGINLMKETRAFQ
jgi:hypothetical protein